MQHMKEHMVEEKPRQTSPSEDRYKTIFERINAAAFLASFDGQILEANQRSYEYLGYEGNELLRLTLQDILSKELDWATCRDELAARGCFTLETEGLCKTGGTFPVEVSMSIFRMEGKIVLFVLLWDITERKIQENRLRESEKKYHGLFEYTTDGIVVLDARGDILDLNTRFCEMLDVTKASVVNKNLFNMGLLTAKSQPVVINEFEQLLSEKMAASYTTEMKTSRGNILDVEISSFFLVKKDNEVDNFVLIIRDITARNEAELKRAHEHELFRTLLDNIPDSVYFKDDQHRFVLVNTAKASHWNITPEEMVGKTEFDFYPPEQAQRIVDDDNAVMRSGQPLINKLERLLRDDGSEHWVSVIKIPRYNEEGDIIGTMGISRDVTEWKRTEEILAKNLEMFQTLMDALPDQVYFKDTQHRFVLVNKATAAHWKVLPEAMIGKTDADFLSAEQAKKTADEELTILKTGTSVVNVEEQMTDTQGQQRCFSVTKVPRYDHNGTIVGILGISRDITEKKNQQELKVQ